MGHRSLNRLCDDTQNYFVMVITRPYEFLQESQSPIDMDFLILLTHRVMDDEVEEEKSGHLHSCVLASNKAVLEKSKSVDCCCYLKLTFFSRSGAFSSA